MYLLLLVLPTDDHTLTNVSLNPALSVLVDLDIEYEDLWRLTLWWLVC